jgi:enterochelin esterase family protein
MPLGHTIQSFWAGPSKQVPDPVASVMGRGSLDDVIATMMSGDGKGGLSPFAKDLLDDVLPLVERTFKVSTRPEDRAIAGLSMGGGQSINVSFNRPDLFRYVALMSPAASARVGEFYGRVLEDGVPNKQFKLFWIGVGKDDGLTGPGDRAFAEVLTKYKIAHTFRVTEGRHEWSVWRHHLRELAPLLFR